MQIHVHLDTSMIKLLPGQGGLQLHQDMAQQLGAALGTSPPAAEDFCTVGSGSIFPSSEKGLQSIMWFCVGSRREVPGNCFLVEMAGYCAKPRVSCSV